MANEFKHKSVGTQMTQSEYEAVGGHVLDSQAAGDLVYASSTTQLSRLGIGTAGKVLAVNSGATAPEWTAAITGVTSIYATDLIIGEDAETAIDFGTNNEIDFKVDNANRLTLTASALYPATDNQIDLGTSSLEFKDAYFDGTVTADAFAGPLTGNADTATVATTVTITDNESTDEDNAIIFTAGGDVDGGNIGLESDGNLTYNPSTGSVTATGFIGALTGNASTATALATARAINGVNFDGTAAITVTAAGSTLSDTVPVSKGGTNATSLADKAVLITQDSGTDTVSAAAMSTNGQLLIGGTSGPAVSTLTAGSNVTITNADGGITIAASSSNTMGDGFVLEDGDGTEVTITENKEVKFVEGNGIDINWTDTDNGTDGDPYDLTFTVDHDAASNFVAAEHYDWSSDISGTATIHANNVTDLHGAGVDGSANQLLTDDGDGTVTSESNLTFDGSTLTVSGDVTLADDKKITLGDEGTLVLSDVSPSTNERGTGMVIKGVLTANVGGGEVVYLKSDGQYERADKDAESTMPAVGVALEDGDGSNAKNILIYGVYKQTGLSLTRGEELYVSDNGYVTHTAPGSGDFLQRIGVALDTNIVLFMPSLDVIEHA